MKESRILVERVKNLCEQKGISLNAFETESGVGRGNVSRWEKNAPGIQKIVATAKYFDVSVDYLIGLKNDPATSVSDEDEVVLNLYRSASSSLQTAAVAVLKSHTPQEKL